MQIFYKKLPFVRKADCTGCGLCESVCHNDCFGVIGGTGLLVQPNACTSEAYCVTACPNSAIRMKWVRFNGTSSVGQWRSTRETLAAQNRCRLSLGSER